MHCLNMLLAAKNEESWLRRQDRLKRRRLHKISAIPEGEFKKLFGLDKKTFYALCKELNEKTSFRGTDEISLECKVLCALSFFATGANQRIVGMTLDLGQRTASRCIKEVVEALNNSDIMARWIKFPTSRPKRDSLKLQFQRRFGLPGVIGCIDCTHVAICKPNKNEHLFYNRKGYHSINVQMVCDYDMRILGVNAKFGGASRDSFIWANSRVNSFMRDLHRNEELVWLLGDSGYPQRSWLMTPILNAVPGSREELYTKRHIQCRNTVERCLVLLKSRWRCLLKEHTLHYQPAAASSIINACCVLHNMALDASQPPPSLHHSLTPEDMDGDTETFSDDLSRTEATQGRAMLNRLVLELM